MIKESENSIIIHLENQWELQCRQSDTQIVIKCQSLVQKTIYFKNLKEVPINFQPFCDSLKQLFELLTTSGAINLVGQKLVITCKIGKIQKKLEIELQQNTISLEDELANTKKLVQKQKTQIQTLNKKIQELQEALKKQKQQVLEFNQFIDEFNTKHVACTKNNCGVAIAKKNLKFHMRGRSGVICDQNCKY